ncbi:hypothetical protein H1C71_000444, partial [Ictidomys tridecemlineatus]
VQEALGGDLSDSQIVRAFGGGWWLVIGGWLWSLYIGFFDLGFFSPFCFLCFLFLVFCFGFLFWFIIFFLVYLASLFLFRMRDQCSQSRVELQEQSSCSEPAFTDHYMVLKDIGEGGFAQLKLARHLLTGTQVAVKVLAKGATKFTLLSEPEMMAELDHPNVI